MGLNTFERDEDLLSAERARDAKREEQGSALGAASGQTYFLKKGKTVLRILGPYSAKGVWFHEILEHPLEVGGKWAYPLCPRPMGSVCPICDHGEQLSMGGGEEAVAAGTPFQPKVKYLFNVVILSDPKGLSAKDGVQVLKAGVKVKRQLLDLDTDVVGGWGDMTNLENGFDVTIERTGEGLMTDYPTKGFPQRSSITENLKSQGVQPDSLEVFDLETFCKPADEEQLKGMLEGKRAVRGFPVRQAPVAAPVVPPTQVLTTGPTPVIPTVEVTNAAEIPAPPEEA